MRYSKGIMWLDDCRIPFNADDKFDIRRYNEYHDTFSSYEDRGSADGKYVVNEPNQQGRFTPNLLVCDDMLNDGVITKQSKRTYKPTENMGSLFGNSPQAHGIGIGDSGSSSRYYDLDKWFDKIIDEIQ
jgi:hypothetical protein